MPKRARLTAKQKVDIIEAYDIQLETMISLAARYGVTRQAIHKILKRAEVDTTKHKYPVSCTTCGEITFRHKGQIRKRLHHFCSSKCYHAFLEAGNGFPYIESTHGRRIGRAIVSQFFSLQEGHIVHHEDRNQFNNEPENLRVFATSGDHLRYHRGFDVEPIWDGRNP